MIPETLRLRMVCDCCGESATFTLSKDEIDSQGFDQVLETILRDESWGVRYPYTICAKCVDRIIEEGLQRMEEKLESERLSGSAEVSG